MNSNSLKKESNKSSKLVINNRVEDLYLELINNAVFFP